MSSKINYKDYYQNLIYTGQYKRAIDFLKSNPSISGLELQEELNNLKIFNENSDFINKIYHNHKKQKLKTRTFSPNKSLEISLSNLFLRHFENNN
jgi:hypothetical protein